MTRNDGSPEDKAQATDRELGKKRIQSILTSRGLPATDAAVRSWEETLWNGDFCCDDYAAAIEKVLSLAEKEGVPLPRYVREATRWLAKICPKYHGQEQARSVDPDKSAAIKDVERKEAKEREVRMSKGLSPEAKAILEKLRSAKALPKGTLPPPASAKFGPDLDKLGAMSDEEAAVLDKEAGAELVVRESRTAPVAPEKLPDVAPPQSQEEDSMPW